MSYEIKRLVADADVIKTVDGERICGLSMTRRAVALVDNDGWDKGNESWLDYRNRTEEERDIEELKRHDLARDLVRGYNALYDRAIAEREAADD